MRNKSSTHREGTHPRAKKSLGQNFLMHAKTAARIADAAGITKEDTVLEIGPGTGMLTKELLKRAKKVIAVEADATLAEELTKTFAKEIAENKLELTVNDIRKVDLNTFPKGYSLVANIPYYITGEILRAFLSSANQPTSITFLVQKEVAERIARSKKESLLSLSVKVYGTPKYEFTVPRGAFVPAPNVDSAVLSIKNISKNAFQAGGEELFFKLIHAGFAHKRKKLAGNLEDLISKEEIRATFATANILDNARAEDLPLATWVNLTHTLSAH